MDKTNTDIIDRIEPRLARIETTLVAIQKDLSYHIKRTDLLDERMTLNKQAVTNKIEPIQKHVTKIQIGTQIILGLLALVPILVGLAVGIKKLLF